MRKFLSFLIVSLALVLSPLNSFSSVDFDNTDDFINVGDSFYSDTLTVCAWIAPDTCATGDGVVIKRGTSADPPAGGSNEWWMRMTSGCAVLFEIFNGGVASGSTTTDSTVSTGAWSHVCATVASGSTGALDMYLNGVDDNADADAKTASISNTTDQIQIGAFSAANAARWFDGKIEEVAIWNTVLTATEIEELAKSRGRHMPLQIQKASLQVYLPLDDGPDGTASCKNGAAGYIDLSGNARNGTGRDGANNTGLTCVAGQNLSYP